MIVVKSGDVQIDLVAKIRPRGSPTRSLRPFTLYNAYNIYTREYRVSETIPEKVENYPNTQKE